MTLALAMSDDPREELLQQDANGQRPLEVFLQQDESEGARGDADFLLHLLVQARSCCNKGTVSNGEWLANLLCMIFVVSI